jgi:hypothetical protein
MALTVSEIDVAIQKILTDGQSVSVDGISYSAANVQSLMNLREIVMQQSSKATRPTIRAMNFSGMGYS